MQDSNYLEKVSEFHNTFGSPVLETPQIPSKERIALRISLLQEELDELSEAAHNDDITEVADALGDLQYVLTGAILEFGLGDKFKEIFDEIHRSNMSKMCTSLDEASETSRYYWDKQKTQCAMKAAGPVNGPDNWIVYRVSDNKTLKSINYSPVDLKLILNRK